MDKLKAKLAAIDAKLDAILANDELTDQHRADIKALESDREEAVKHIKERAELDAKQAARIKERDDEDARQRENERGRRQVSGFTDRQQPGVGTAAIVASLTPTDSDRRRIATGGYNGFGAFAMDVMQCSISRQPSDRLIGIRNYERAQMAATGMGEAVGSDGGFLVPVEFAMKIFERIYTPESLLSRCDNYRVGGNSIVFPRNSETSRANGSRWGGVTSAWLGEGSQGTASKPTYGRLTLNLHKLMTIGVATDELLADSAMPVDAYMNRCFAGEINFRVGDAIVNGTGAGQPLGILNADCTVSVAKESGQSVATINASNILKMWSRLWSGSRSNAVWLINQDVEPQLNSMQIGTGVANQLVYMPPGGLSGAPYATLIGKPVIAVEWCSTLGTVGDIILVDLSQWVAVTKAGGPEQAMSMHFYFDTDQQAFRITFRIDAQPWWAAALTPFKGTATQSCAVTLATR